MKNRVIRFYKVKKLRVILEALGFNKRDLNEYLNVDIMLTKDVDRMFLDLGYHLTIGELFKGVDLDQLFLIDQDCNTDLSKVQVPVEMLEQMQKNILECQGESPLDVRDNMNVLNVNRNSDRNVNSFNLTNMNDKERQNYSKRREKEIQTTIKEKSLNEQKALKEKERLAAERKRIDSLFVSKVDNRNSEMLKLSEFKDIKDNKIPFLNFEERFKLKQKQEIADKRNLEKKQAKEQKEILKREIEAKKKADLEQKRLQREQENLSRLEASKKVLEEKNTLKLEKEKERARIEKEREEQRLLLLEQKAEEKRKLDEIKQEEMNRVKAEQAQLAQIKLEEQNRLKSEKEALEKTKQEEMLKKQQAIQAAKERERELYAARELEKQQQAEKQLQEKLEEERKLAEIKLQKNIEKQNKILLKKSKVAERKNNKYLARKNYIINRAEKVNELQFKKELKAFENAEYKFKKDVLEYKALEQKMISSDIVIVKDEVEIVYPNELAKIDDFLYKEKQRRDSVVDQIEQNVIKLFEDESIEISRDLQETTDISTFEEQLSLDENHVLKVTEEYINAAYDIDHEKTLAKLKLHVAITREKQEKRDELLNKKASNKLAEMAKKNLELEKDAQTKKYKKILLAEKKEEKIKTRLAQAQEREQQRIIKNGIITKEKLYEVELKNQRRAYNSIQSAKTEINKRERKLHNTLHKHFVYTQKAIDKAHKLALIENNSAENKRKSELMYNHKLAYKQESLYLRKEKIAENARLKTVKEKELQFQRERAALIKHQEYQNSLRLKRLARIKYLEQQKSLNAKAAEEKAKRDRVILQAKADKESIRLEKELQMLASNEVVPTKKELKEKSKQKTLLAKAKIRDEKTEARRLRIEAKHSKKVDLSAKELKKHAKFKIKNIESESSDILITNHDFVNKSKEEVLREWQGKRLESNPSNKQFRMMKQRIMKESTDKNVIKLRIKALREKDLERRRKYENEAIALNDQISIRNENRLRELEVLKTQKYQFVREQIKIDKELKKISKMELDKQKNLESTINRKSKNMALNTATQRKNELMMQRATVEKRLQSVKQRQERTNLEYELLKHKLTPKSEIKIEKKPKTKESVSFINTTKTKVKEVSLPKRTTKQDKKIEVSAYNDEIRLRREEALAKVEEMRKKHHGAKAQREAELRMEIEKDSALKLEDRLAMQKAVKDEIDSQKDAMLKTLVDKEKVTEREFRKRIQLQLDAINEEERLEIKRIKEASKNLTKQQVRMEIQSIKQKSRIQRLRVESQTVKREVNEKLAYVDIE